MSTKEMDNLSDEIASQAKAMSFLKGNAYKEAANKLGSLAYLRSRTITWALRNVAYERKRKQFYLQEAQRLALLVRELGGDPEPKKEEEDGPHEDR